MLALAVLAATASCSCVVPSIYPWFGKDVCVFEKGLLGNWVGDLENDEGVAAVSFSLDRENSYNVRLSNGPRANPKSGVSIIPSVFTAKLAKLGDSYYLDLRQLQRASEESEEIADALLYLHHVTRVEFDHAHLTIWRMDGEKFASAVRKGEFKDLKVIWLWPDSQDELPMVISGPKELQEFFVVHAQDAGLWTEYMRLTRRK